MAIRTETQTLRVAAAVSQAGDPVEAGRTLARAVAGDLGGGGVDLACLFFSSHHAAHARELSEAVRCEVDSRVLVGCTGEGVIGNSSEIESGPAAALWAARLPGVELSPLRLPPSSAEPPPERNGWTGDPVAREAPPVFLLLADPFSTPMNDVLAMIGRRWPGAPAIGGLAGGGYEIGGTRMLLNEEVYDGGLVGVGLSGPVNVRTVISQGCRPIGDRLVVTKSQHNVIHELSGEPALEQLKAVFQGLNLREQELAQRALHVGIVIDEHRNRYERGDFLIRNLVGADQRTLSLAIGEIVQEGQTVQFHVRDADSASEDLRMLLAEDRLRHHDRVRGALLFSCCARGRALFSSPDHDASAVRHEAGDIPVAGFFAQGEIGPVRKQNFLHGYTASVALFCDPRT